MTINEKLQRAAENAAGMGLTYKETAPVIETFRGEVVWEGVVSTFSSRDATVYAWAVKGATEPQYVAVLGGGRIDSPLAAVRAWLVSQQ